MQGVLILITGMHGGMKFKAVGSGMMLSCGWGNVGLGGLQPKKRNERMCSWRCCDIRECSVWAC